MIVESFGLVVAAAALVVAILAWRESRRSARASERSAGSAESSASSAERSATASERSAVEAARMSTIEMDRRHDELRPTIPTRMPLSVRDSRSPGRVEVFGSITVPRDYRVIGTSHRGQGQSTLSLPLLLRAEQPVEFHLGTVPYGEPLLVDEVRFQFWPPAEVDDVDPWTCPCARSGAAKDPHWMVIAQVVFQPIPAPGNAEVYPWKR